jgi:hypothetical protein
LLIGLRSKLGGKYFNSLPCSLYFDDPEYPAMVSHPQKKKRNNTVQTSEYGFNMMRETEHIFYLLIAFT